MYGYYKKKKLSSMNWKVITCKPVNKFSVFSFFDVIFKYLVCPLAVLNLIVSR